ncbi:mboa-3 [Pristionchus pacificus]|uniref:Mboa-3 n=1 Tax=Pristionchus pacificus TaxID=54126 RepID=A0A454XUY2_PRIPA|nr:mboa-3 [Pristionchus pacificus]|eukprot:PDM64596.1 mboa-3 [Pristionchus pacificus]
MPGEHTFNSGSVLLQPVADLVGMSVDKINFVGCMALSIPLAIIYNRVLGKASERTRQVYPLVIGLAYCWFCFGSAIKHLLANCLISYAIMYVAPAKNMHWLVFIFSMSYLTWVHLFRWMYITEYTIDITGPIMVCVQKMTTLAFSLHDGTGRKEEELSPLQKREAIKRVPGLIPYLSYIFHFQSILTGPLSFYTDYINLTRGTHVTKNENGEVPDPYSEAWTKLGKALIFMLVIAFVQPSFPISGLDRTDMNPVAWMVLFWFTFMLQRIPYYFAWYFADGIYNLSGFGFNGYDKETGEAKWDLATNVLAWKVESAQSLKETLDAWNVGTMGWFRRVAFDRAPKKYRTLSTYLLSAWWHGIFMGYYLTFLGGAILTLGGKGFRRSLRWRFLSSPSLKFAYDVVTFIGTKMVLAYVAYPFVALHWAPSIAMYKRLYFIGHILALFCAAVLPVILPPPREDKKKNGETQVDENRNAKKIE